MRSFFTAFYNSLFNSSWLKAVRFFPGKAWGYFCLLVFFFAAISVIPSALHFRSFLFDLNKSFETLVPEFQATVKDGNLSVEKLQQPFVYRSDDFVIIVDTLTTSTATLEQYVTTTNSGSIIITATEIEVRDSRTGEGKVQSWSKMPDFSFSKSDAGNFVGRLTTPAYTVLAVFVIFIGLYVGFFVSKLYNIVLATLMVSVAARLFGRGMKFGELFTMALYAITLPTILSFLLALTGITISYIQFIALLAFMLSVVFTKEPGEQPKAE